MFCSAVEFGDWHRLLDGERARLDMETEDWTEPTKEEGSMCEVEEIPLTNTRAPGHYLKNTMKTSINHMSVSEMAIHLCSSSIHKKDHLAKVDYSEVAEGNKNHPGWTSQTNNIACVPHLERMFRDNRERKDTRLQLW